MGGQCTAVIDPSGDGESFFPARGRPILERMRIDAPRELAWVE